MGSCQHLLLVATCVVLLLATTTFDICHAQAARSVSVLPSAAPAPAATPTVQLQQVEEPQYVVITEDVIPDVENTTQKVIRVNPLDLPSIRDNPTSGSADSSLFNIQSLLPAHRNYVNSNRMRRPRPKQQLQDSAAAGTDDSPIIRHLPQPKRQKPHKKHHKQQQRKQLHFLYNQEGLDGRVVGKTMNVHVAPGAYPVYYAVSKTNGRFGKYPIKSFSNQADFLKYLVKTKLQPIDMLQRQRS